MTLRSALEDAINDATEGWMTDATIDPDRVLAALAERGYLLFNEHGYAMLAAGLDAEVLAEALWNVFSVRGWSEHAVDECLDCDYYRALTRTETPKLVAEYRRLADERPRKSYIGELIAAQRRAGWARSNQHSTDPDGCPLCASHHDEEEAAFMNRKRVQQR